MNSHCLSFSSGEISTDQAYRYSPPIFTFNFASPKAESEMFPFGAFTSFVESPSHRLEALNPGATGVRGS